MSVLSALMKKRSVRLATAIPAIPATDGRVEGGTVAKIATVAVANPQNRKGEAATVARIATVAIANREERKTAPAPKVSPGGTATWWRIRYADGKLLELVRCPPATHAEILERYPDAVSAKPFELTIRPPGEPLNQEDEAAIRRWLAEIGETDAAVIAEVIGQCQRDADARDYFMALAGGEPWL
jgi:hypothetical protein